MQLKALEEGVITMVDTDTGKPVALIRKNGSIEWFMLKEITWSDFQELFDVNNNYVTETK